MALKWEPVSVFEILFTWHTGMTLCATTNDVLFRDIQHIIRGMNITHLSLTPTVASLVNRKEVPGVQFLVTAGETLTEKVHQDWAGKELYQGMYTVDSYWHLLLWAMPLTKYFHNRIWPMRSDQCVHSLSKYRGVAFTQKYWPTSQKYFRLLGIRE